MKNTNSKKYMSPDAQPMIISASDVIAVSGLGGEEVIELNEHYIMQ